MKVFFIISCISSLILSIFSYANQYDKILAGTGWLVASMLLFIDIMCLKDLSNNKEE